MQVNVLADPRIAHPDAKEQIMSTLATMLSHRCAQRHTQTSVCLTMNVL